MFHDALVSSAESRGIMMMMFYYQHANFSAVSLMDWKKTVKRFLPLPPLPRWKYSPMNVLSWLMFICPLYARPISTVQLTVPSLCLHGSMRLHWNEILISPRYYRMP